jgi:tetratricopeptide (TPR) repeat protein
VTVTLVICLLLSGCSPPKERASSGDRAASNAASAEAEEAVRAGRVADAEAAWQRAIRLDSQNPAPYASRARLRWARRQFREAAEDFSEASRRNPKDVEIILAEIQVRQDGGDERHTEELARRALALQPDNPKALVYLGRYLSRLSNKTGARREARQVLEKAVRLAPSMPIPLVELGCLLLREGEAAVAEPYLSAAWEQLHKGSRTLQQLEAMSIVEMRRAETAYTLAQCARAQGRVDQAAAWLKRFREVNARIDLRSQVSAAAMATPPDLDALVKLAKLDIETGGALEAVPLVRRGLQFAPNDARLRHLVEKLQRTPTDVP